MTFNIEHRASSIGLPYLRLASRMMCLASCVLLLASCFSTTHAQKNFGVNSYGVNFGRYSPSFDTWKGTVWNFGTATMVGVDMDLDMAQKVRLRIGAAGGSSAATVLRDPGVGNEELRYRFLPIGATVIVHTPLQLFEVYGGAGLDLMSIKATYESTIDRSEISGSAYLPHVLVGLQVMLAERVNLSVQAKQVLGTYDQQFQLEGENNVRVTQPVEMQGLYWSVGMRVKIEN